MTTTAGASRESVILHQRKQSVEYDDYVSQVTRWLKKDDIAGAIGDLEQRIQKLEPSPFHKALGRSWLKQQSQLAKWLKKLYAAASKQFVAKALYVEMNRFDINTDRWYLDGFAFDEFGGDKDIEWLCNSKYTTEDSEQFKLTGMSDLQKAYESLTEDESSFFEAEQAVVLLLTLRMLEVVQAAASEARANGWLPEDVPVVAAAHEADPTQCFYGAIKPKKKREPKAKLPVVSADPPAPGWLGIYEPTNDDPRGNSYPFALLRHISCTPTCLLGDEEALEIIEEHLDTVLSNTSSAMKDWVPLTDFAIRSRRSGWDCDIMYLAAGDDAWAFTEAARDALAPVFGSHAEFLPIKPENGPTLWLLHVLTVVEAAPDAEYEEDDLDLNPEQVQQVRGLPAFRYYVSRYEAVLCVSESVKRAYAELGLRGWVFEERFRFKAKN